jgi:CrcB protein
VRPRDGAARRRSWTTALVVAAGGAIGAVARYSVSEAWPTAPASFPWSTFVVNVTGCLLIGQLMVVLLEVWRPGPYARPFLAIGVLGGYTTFSTYTSDTRALLLDGRAPVALAYLFGTMVAALLATYVGVVVARAVTGTARGGAR